MKKYIWFNPVVQSICAPDYLETFCSTYNLNRVESDVNFIEVVKDKYDQKVKEVNQPLIDQRCPLAAKEIEQYDQGINHDIDPILIHTAKHLYQVYVKDTDNTLIVTTPCQSLADLGNDLGLENVTFVAWLAYLESLEYPIQHSELEASPIPPGFFDTHKHKVLNLKSKEQINTYFESNNANEYDIIEMFYCENGCHNGDGIVHGK